MQYLSFFRYYCIILLHWLLRSVSLFRRCFGFRKHVGRPLEWACGSWRLSLEVKKFSLIFIHTIFTEVKQSVPWEIRNFSRPIFNLTNHYFAQIIAHSYSDFWWISFAAYFRTHDLKFDLTLFTYFWRSYNIASTSISTNIQLALPNQ